MARRLFIIVALVSLIVVCRAGSFSTLADIVPDHENFDRSLLQTSEHAHAPQHDATHLALSNSNDNELDAEIENAYEESVNMQHANQPAHAEQHADDLALAELSASAQRGARVRHYDAHDQARRNIRRRRRATGGRRTPLSMRPHPTYPLAYHRRGWNLAREFKRADPTRGKPIPSSTALPTHATGYTRRIRRRDGRGRVVRQSVRGVRRQRRNTRAAARKAVNARKNKLSTRDRKRFGSPASRFPASRAQTTLNAARLNQEIKRAIIPEASGPAPDVKVVHTARLGDTLSSQQSFVESGSRFSPSIGAPLDVLKSRAAQREMFLAKRKARDAAAERAKVHSKVAAMEADMAAEAERQEAAANFAVRNQHTNNMLRSFAEHGSTHQSYFTPIPRNFLGTSRRRVLPSMLQDLIDQRRNNRRRKGKRVHMRGKYQTLHDGGIPGSDDHPERVQFQAQKLAEAAQARGEGYFLETAAQTHEAAQLTVEQQNLAHLFQHEQEAKKLLAKKHVKQQEHDDLELVFGSHAPPPMARLPHF